ncbi:MAG: glycyl-radical enzyme activating protein [Bacteroidota bacterium]
MKGLIFSVKRYAIHDGPGIRVTFFMKGCPLSCWWCHNPEGISPDIEAVDQIEKVGDREFVKTADAGRWYPVDDVLEILEKEKIFFDESKGGVTFSGGEPLIQADFLLETLKACKKKGYHTAVDTSGYSPAENYLKIIPWTDLFLFDLKHMDNQTHIKYTGVSNKLILNNLKLILESGKDLFIRIPVIPGFNDSAENLNAFKQFILDLKRDNLKKISLLPYHRIGKAKYSRFRIPYRMEGIETPSRGRMNELKEFFEETGVKTRIGG